MWKQGLVARAALGGRQPGVLSWLFCLSKVGIVVLLGCFELRHSFPVAIAMCPFMTLGFMMVSTGYKV